MALANNKYTLNHVEDTAYIVIKNDQVMLEKLFNGLFVVARRHLGYTPNSSSYPFMTRCFSKSSLASSVHERTDLEFAMNNNIVITPDSLKHKKNEVLTIALNGHIDFIRKAIIEANKDVEQEDRLDYTKATVNNVYKALVEDYWDDILDFAKDNRTYIKSWQSYRHSA